MITRATAALGVAILCMSAPQLSSTAVAQEPAKPIRDTLVIDHESREIHFMSGRRSREIKPGERVEDSAVHTGVGNRDAYELGVVRVYRQDAGKRGTRADGGSDVSERARSLRHGAERSNIRSTPLPEGIAAAGPDTAVPAGPCAPASRIASDLKKLDRYVTGRDQNSGAWSLADTRVEGVTALMQMGSLGQKDTGAADTSIEMIASQYRSKLAIASGHRGQLRVAIVDSVVTTLESLRRSRSQTDLILCATTASRGRSSDPTRKKLSSGLMKPSSRLTRSWLRHTTPRSLPLQSRPLSPPSSSIR